jgi:hypothetical protein
MQILRVGWILQSSYLRLSLIRPSKCFATWSCFLLLREASIHGTYIIILSDAGLAAVRGVNPVIAKALLAAVEAR